MRRNGFATFTLLWLTASVPVAAEEPNRGFLLGAACLNCHSLTSASIKGIPSLEPHSVASITEALDQFKAGTRESTIMGRLAAGYTDDEIRLIAKWLKGR
ncbi:MAG: c-type cytochrome [Gammaproteobacteria bacterium]